MATYQNVLFNLLGFYFVFILFYVPVTLGNACSNVVWEFPSYIKVLDEKIFADIKDGNWFVEFYSPRCPHCCHFKSIFSNFISEYKDFLNKSAIRVGVIDCDKHWDTCTGPMDVHAFPTLKTYRNANFLKDYGSNFTTSAFTQFVASNLSRIFLEKVVVPSHAPSGAAELLRQHAARTLAVDGVVAELDGRSFFHRTESLPWVVLVIDRLNPVLGDIRRKLDVVAASYVKKIAVGILHYGADLGGVLDILGVGTDKGEVGLVAYASGLRVVYQGPFSIRSLQGFMEATFLAPIEQAASTEAVRAMLGLESDVAVEINFNRNDTVGVGAFLEALALYPLPPGTRVAAVPNDERGAISRVLVHRLHVKEPSQMLLLRTENGKMGAVARHEIVGFLNRFKYPLIPRFDENSAIDIVNDAVEMFHDETVIIIGVVDPDNFQSSLDELKSITSFTKSRVVWMDGIRWSSYLLRKFRLDSRNVPFCVIVAPVLNAFFVRRQSGKLLSLLADDIEKALYHVKEKIADSIHAGKPQFDELKSAPEKNSETSREVDHLIMEEMSNQKEEIQSLSSSILEYAFKNPMKFPKKERIHRSLIFIFFWGIVLVIAIRIFKLFRRRVKRFRGRWTKLQTTEDTPSHRALFDESQLQKLE